MMEQLNKYRSPIVLGVLVLFLLLFAFYMLGLQPTLEQLDEQQSEIQTMEDEIALLQGKVDEMKGTTDSTDKGASNDSLEALPQSDLEDQIVRDLRQIGIRSDAVLRSVDFSLADMNSIHTMTGEGGEVYPFVDEIKMNAEVEGTYAQITSWLEELEKLPRLMKVDSLNLQRRSSLNISGDSTIITANIAFTAYYEAVK